MIITHSRKGATSVYYAPDDAPTYPELEELLKQARLEIQQCRETIEDVAVGTQLECRVCGRYHPCNCDKGQNHG